MLIMDEFFDDTRDEREIVKKAEGGSVRISPEVVSTIAGIAAEETDGVAGLYASLQDTIAEKFGSKKRGVKLEMTDKTAVVDLYITIKYGYKVREVSERIQQSVKNNIETMTGLSVLGVNVHVESVAFEKNNEKDSEGKGVVVEDEE